MKGIYRFHWYAGRAGDVRGLFIADSEEIEEACGKHVYFGEILGKHSEVQGVLELNDFKVISTAESDIEVFERLRLHTGYNPLEYLYEDED